MIPDQLPFYVEHGNSLVESARDGKALPILDELGHRIDRRIRQVELAMSSSDELTMIAVGC